MTTCGKAEPSRRIMESVMEPQQEKNSGLSREIFRLKFDLTSRECALHNVKTIETHLRKRNEELQAEAAASQARVAEFEANLRNVRNLHDTQVKQFGQQIASLREAVWTETSKATVVERELDKTKETLNTARKELESEEEYRHRLLQEHISQRRAQEIVITTLDSQLEELSRANDRLNDEIVYAVENRDLAKKGREDTLGQLDRLKTKQDSDGKIKDEQIKRLTKELLLAQRQVAQFAVNPTDQFKLITELYTAFVAAEDKIATFEEKETALAQQQRQGIATIQEFKDELVEVRGIAKEYEEALRVAERDLERLKKTNPVSVDEDDIPHLDDSDVADLRRELELYRMQDMDEDKRKFFTSVAHNPDQFRQCVSLASNEAIIWIFIADHGAEAQVAEVKRLKHELHIARSRCLALQNHNERLSDDWMEVQRTTASEIDELKNSLRIALTEAGDLKVQVRDMDRMRGTHAAEVSRFRDDLAERDRQLSIEQLRLQEMSKDIATEREDLVKLRSNLSTSSATVVTLQQQKDLLIAEKAALEKEITALRRDLVRLSDAAPNVEATYWMSESERLRDVVDQQRQILQSLQNDLTTIESLRVALQERDAAQSQVATVSTERDALHRDNDEARTRIVLLQERVIQLGKQYDIELRAHQATAFTFKDMKSDLSTARAQITENEIAARELRGSLESLSRLHANQERIHRAESALWAQERSNNEDWKESFYKLMQSSLSSSDLHVVDLTSVLRHVRAENDLLKKQAQLANAEYQSVVSGINALERTVQRLETERRNDSMDSWRVSGSDSISWQKRLEEKKEMLATALEYTQYLRAEIVDVKDKISQSESTAGLLRQELAEAQSLIESLEIEQMQLLTKQKSLEAKLDESNQRFDTDRQRLHIVKLNEQLATAKQQKIDTAVKAKEHYQSQLNGIRIKHAQEMEERASTALADLTKAVADKDNEISSLRRVHEAASEALTNRLRAVTDELTKVKQRCNATIAKLNSAEAKLVAESETAAQLRKQLQESAEKVRKLEAAAALRASQISIPQHQSVIVEPAVSPVAPLSTRRATTLSSPPGQPARSTAIVMPQSQPTSAIQRNVVPQLRVVSEPPHPVNPLQTHAQENRHGHPVPSTSGTSGALSPALRRDRPAIGTGNDDPGSPSTSSSGNTTQGRKRALSGIGFERDKRQVKREDSPTFSDVTSSTSTGPKIAPVADATLLRARANSASLANAEHALAMAPHDHHELVPLAEDLDRAVDSSDGNPDGNELNQEGNITESNDDEAAGNQPFVRNIAEVSEQEREDDGRYHNEDSVDGEEADDENERLAHSSEGGLSPPTGMDEEVVSDDDDGGNEMPNEAPEFAPEDEESSSGSYDAEDVERPAQSSSGVSSQEPSTSSGRLRPVLPMPLDRHLSGARSPGMAPGSARTPGLLFPRYDTGDEYGVVPSTPKFPVLRRDDDGNTMPQVPSFSFGGLAEAIEDVTASQVPPTPHHPDGDFFSQRLEIASEDSSSFQGPDDIVDPVPSGSGMRREDSFPNSESGVGSSITFSSQEFAQQHEDSYLTDEASTSQDPAVPSPGSAGSSVEAQSSMPTGNVGRRGTRRGTPRTRASSGRIRSLTTRSASLASNPEAPAAQLSARLPILAPFTPSSLSRSVNPSVPPPFSASRGAPGTRRRAGRGPGRKRSNLK